jgi:hypothetical protein
VRIWPYDRASGDHTIDVLRRLRTEIPTGKLIVLWDGAPYHRAKPAGGAGTAMAENGRGRCPPVMPGTRDKPGHRLRAGIHAFGCCHTARRGWWAFEVVIFSPLLHFPTDVRQQYSKNVIHGKAAMPSCSLLATYSVDGSNIGTNRGEKITTSCAHHDVAERPVPGSLFS